MSAAWTLLVCGNPVRGDDGAAIAAVDGLRAALPASVRVAVVGQLEADVLADALAAGPCLVLDTVRGATPGTVVERRLADLDQGGPAASSSHVLPMPATVALARALGADLSRGRLLGIGGADFRVGAPLGPAVSDGLDAYRHAILDAIGEEQEVPPWDRRSPERSSRG